MSHDEEFRMKIWTEIAVDEAMVTDQVKQAKILRKIYDLSFLLAEEVPKIEACRVVAGGITHMGHKPKPKITEVERPGQV